MSFSGRAFPPHLRPTATNQLFVLPIAPEPLYAVRLVSERQHAGIDCAHRLEHAFWHKISVHSFETRRLLIKPCAQRGQVTLGGATLP